MERHNLRRRGENSRSGPDTERSDTIQSVTARLRMEEGFPEDQQRLIFPGMTRAQEVWHRILPQRNPPDLRHMIYEDTFQWWTQREPEKYAMAINELKTKHGKAYTDGFFRIHQRQGECRTPRLSEPRAEGL